MTCDPVPIAYLLITAGVSGWTLAVEFHDGIARACDRGRRRLRCWLRGHCRVCRRNPLGQTCCVCNRPLTPAAVDAWRS